MCVNPVISNIFCSSKVKNRTELAPPVTRSGAKIGRSHGPSICPTHHHLIPYHPQQIICTILAKNRTIRLGSRLEKAYNYTNSFLRWKANIKTQCRQTTSQLLRKHTDKHHRSTWYPTHGLEKQPNNMDLENHMTLNSIVLNTENDIPNPPYS